MLTRNRKFFIIINLLIAGLIFTNAGCVKKEASMNNKNLIYNKDALVIVAFRGFQDLEFSKTKELLENAGVKVTVASSSLGTAVGKFDQRVEVDNTINDVNVGDYNLVAFIGGPGAIEYVDNPVAHNLAQEAIKSNKVLAAICLGPEILAKAGVLSGKKATVWSSVIDQSPVKILTDAGAQYLDQEVVVDGNIITANGPSAAENFAKAIIEKL